MGKLRYLMCMCLSVCSCDLFGNDLDGHDGVAILVEMQAEQPTAPRNGVLVRIASRGGKTLELALDSGTYVAAASCATPVPDAGACTCFAADGQLALSVRPTDNEALLSLILRPEDACKGASLASRQVPIKPVAVSDHIDAGAVDAGAVDAGAVDAAAVDAGGIDAR